MKLNGRTMMHPTAISRPIFSQTTPPSLSPGSTGGELWPKVAFKPSMVKTEFGQIVYHQGKSGVNWTLVQYCRSKIFGILVQSRKGQVRDHEGARDKRVTR
jgi:hypothetical protein